jgi:hypothetical protein
MSPPPRFLDLTLDEINKLRDNLLRPMLLEPVIDPGFERPVEKLRFLNTETKECLDSLIETFRLLDLPIKRMDKLLATLDAIKEQIASFHVDLSEFQKPEETLTETLSWFGKPKDLVDKLSESKRRKNGILVQRERIFQEGQLLPFEGMNLRLSIMSDQLQTAQLAVVLERTAEQISKGTQEAFRSQESSDPMRELAMDGLDTALEFSELPAVGPLIHIFKMALSSQRQREGYESGLRRQWTKFEYTVFLSAYFKWWTDDNGKAEISGLVSDCQGLCDKAATSVESFTGKLKDLLTGISALGQQMIDYQNFNKALQELIASKTS